MKIAGRKIINGLLIGLIMLFVCCKKQDAVNERQLTPNDGGVNKGNDRRLRRPRVPWVPQPPSRCIYTFQDIVDALGTNRVIVKKVILESGASVEPGNDLAYIAYEAIPSTQTNSVFDSKLSVEWRWTGGDWQLSTANVWSLGCMYQQAGQPPYTNLIKGSDTILINTCFYWSTNVHTGERVDYLVVE